MKKLLVYIAAAFLVVPLYSVTFNGNGNSGFGGIIGTGSLELTDNGTTVSGILTKGSADFSDSMVIYIDSVAGGFSSTASLNDQGDDLRRAISYGANTLTFDSGFEADYAIALGPTQASFGGIWQLAAGGDNSLVFVQSANLAPLTSNNATYTFDFDFSEIGLVGASNFDFVATYLNGTNAFLSDESIGSAIGGGNPGSGGATLSGFESYVVPEPSTYAALGGLAALGIALLRRRRS